jgi:hypothetical protein
MPIFPDIFSPLLDRPAQSCLSPRPVTCDSSHSIYPIDFLSSLIEKIKTNSGEEENTHTVRFLVDIYARLWFAEEGGPSKIIPAHYQITGDAANSARCITAGNIKFSADHREIISINHKSGDFRPPFDTLKWVLAILIANEDRLAAVSVRLADKINIQKLSSSGGSDEEPTYTIEKSALATDVRRIFDINELRIQPTAIKETTYNRKRRRTNYDSDEQLSPKGHGGAAASAKLFFDFVAGEPCSPPRAHAARSLLESPHANAAAASASDSIIISSPPRRPRGAGSRFFGAALLLEDAPLVTAATEAPVIPDAPVAEESVTDKAKL